MIESLFYVVFYDDKTSAYTTFKFLKNEIIKYPVSCILYPVPPFKARSRNIKSGLEDKTKCTLSANFAFLRHSNARTDKQM